MWKIHPWAWTFEVIHWEVVATLLHTNWETLTNPGIIILITATIIIIIIVRFFFRCCKCETKEEKVKLNLLPLRNVQKKSGCNNNNSNSNNIIFIVIYTENSLQSIQSKLPKLSWHSGNSRGSIIECACVCLCLWGVCGHVCVCMSFVDVIVTAVCSE